MDTLQPGQMIGPYQVISQIGKGGMATVYKAYHAAMDRYIALKILPRQLLENPEFSGRFRQEARIIANLEHPHILPVHDYGESEGLSYLVMRYIDTGTLKDRMSARRLTMEEIDRYFLQLADALAYAHRRGVIHRDIKPSNVMVDEQDNLFLMDFGIAKLLESSSQFTGSGALIGTPDYMSPEQAQGLKVDLRTDVYSLGIILYEMVTGQVPFEAETPLAVILKHISAPLPLPATLVPGLPESIERVLLKALAKDPGDRFSDVTAFQSAWQQARQEAGALVPGIAGEKTLPEPVETPGAAPARSTATLKTVVAPPSRKRLPWRLIVPSGVGLLALGALLVWMLPQLLPASSPTAAPLSTPTMGLANVATPLPTRRPTTTGPTPLPSPTWLPVLADLPPGEWTTWVGSNHPGMVLARGDEIIAAGYGLSIWNRGDGTLLRQFGGPSDGLPGVYLTALVQDSQGNLWVGSAHGVGRYDGAQWITYGENAWLDSLNIGALAWLSDTLWVGTQYCETDGCGLGQLVDGIYQPAPNFPSAVESSPGRVSAKVTALLPAQNGIWVGTRNGLVFYTSEAQQVYFVENGLPDNDIHSLRLDQAGTLWVMTPEGAARFNGSDFEAIPALQGSYIVDMIQDRQGWLWFSGDGLAVYNPPADTWRVYTVEDGLLSETYYLGAIDADGVLYFGSDNGLLRIQDLEFSHWRTVDGPENAEFGRILAAPDGQAIWFIGHNGNRWPDRYDVENGTWSVVGYLPKGCHPLALEAGESLWCGGSEGLWFVDADGRQMHLTSEHGLPDGVITLVAPLPGSSGAAWVAVEQQGLARVENFQVVQVIDGQVGESLSSALVTALLAASDGSLWVGSDQGLDRLLPGGTWEHYLVGLPFTNDLTYVQDIAEDQQGGIWVATEGEGSVVYRLRGGQWQSFRAGDPGVFLPESVVECITAAPDGSLWFGSWDGGAARFDGQTWQLFGIADGMLDENVHDIYVSQAGEVWIASQYGLSRFVPATSVAPPPPSLTLEGGEQAIRAVAFSPDNAYLASAGEDQLIRIWDAVSGSLLLTLAGHENIVTSLAWSPDGEILASGSDDHTIRFWDTATGEQAQPLLAGHTDFVLGVAWSPDGTRLASVGWDHQLLVWDLASRQPVARAEIGMPNSISWSADGQLLAASGTHEVWVLEAATGEVVQHLTGEWGDCWDVAWSPNGQFLAVTGHDYDIHVWQVEQWDQERLLKGFEDTPVQVSWSPDSRWVAASGFDGTIRIWDVSDSTDSPALTILIGGGGVLALDWSPDGNWLAAGDGDIWIWSVQGLGLQE